MAEPHDWEAAGRLHGPLRPLGRERLQRAAPDAAVALLGALLVREHEDGRLVARVVETEAYREDDAASHSRVGRTRRTEPMFRRPGTAYVYRSYGIHWCCNVSAEPAGTGAAVLLRAAALLEGHEQVRPRRPAARRDRDLLRGPGRLTAGLDLDGHRHDRVQLLDPDGEIWLADDGWRPPAGSVASTGRVGVRLAADVAWRFHLVGHPAVSDYRRHPRADEATAS